ncbi:Peptidase S8/S53 subtilisin/kexin/sedolisin [Penicillium alfredii]|uniref:Peptidase S8/S53 subtilisin/kexin/sedolisin n=1 Tax=Penicillium alfredii TaxID=1506179 RepID=A0A9W9FJT6_9EURO|nr:Peptidase S8/S53 subtilisin/kexin/sedolisin [Penicillium alfredii]KAJ5101433.1 Peptidase S8/S53 subtilisin/kexin/sedolisin [Penicillium alfredii]
MAGQGDYTVHYLAANEFYASHNYQTAFEQYEAARWAFLAEWPTETEHEDILELKARAAKCLQRLHRYEESRMLNFEVLRIRQRIFRPDDERVLVVREELAKDHRALGAHQLAIPLLRQNLNVLASSPIYGEESEWTWQTRYYLAMEVKAQGNYQEALALLESTLPGSIEKNVGAQNIQLMQSAIRSIENILNRQKLTQARPSSSQSMQRSAIQAFPPAVQVQGEQLAQNTQPREQRKPQGEKNQRAPSQNTQHHVDQVQGSQQAKKENAKKPMKTKSPRVQIPQASGRKPQHLNQSPTPVTHLEQAPTQNGTKAPDEVQGNSSREAPARLRQTVTQEPTKSERWLKDVEEKVLSWLPRAKERDKTRIAILDTGIDLGHPYFGEHHRTGDAGVRRDSIVEYLSFLPGKKGDEDVHGHGTHAAALIQRVAPNALLYVARVIDDDGEISDADVVAEAIEHAIDKRKWGVQIISLSLGFKTVPESVATAIDKAKKQDVLVFAAASNNGRNDPIPVTYPARSRDVFAVYATSYWGTWKEFNPKVGFGIGTLGENVTAPWTRHGSKEVEPYRCRTGTSIATPILAASAALALQYIYQKPPLRIKDFDMRRLKGMDGMALLLSLMTREWDGDDHRYVSPEFWLGHWEDAKDKLTRRIRLEFHIEH